MYTYNKDDKSYTFSSDDIELNELIDINPDSIDNIESNSSNTESTVNSENEDSNKPHKKIEVINGGNDLDISPVTNYIEIEKPKNEKKENIVIPEEKK